MKTLIATLVATLSLGANAQDKATSQAEKSKLRGSTEISIQGYIVDAMCARNMAGKENTMTRAMAHTRSCALEEECAASGFGVFADSKWYKFDEKGDVAAKELLEKTKTARGIKVEVKGTMNGTTLAVAELREVTAQTTSDTKKEERKTK